MDADIILRVDGWYWFDLDGRMIGPYDTRQKPSTSQRWTKTFCFSGTKSMNLSIKLVIKLYEQHQYKLVSIYGTKVDIRV